MSENPDNKMYIGFGPQAKMKVICEDTESANYGKEIELNMDARYLIPVQHQLRFVWQRGVGHEGQRILQQYQWSQEKGEFDWYDIPLVSE